MIKKYLSNYNLPMSWCKHSQIISFPLACMTSYSLRSVERPHREFKRWNHQLTEKHPPVELNYKYVKGSSSLSPIVICHGMLGSHQNWSMIGKRLNQETGRSVYIPDMRNHGNSPHSSKMTYYDMASDIEFFIQNHELGNVVVLGKFQCLGSN